MSLKLDENEFLILCPHSTLVRTVQVCELEEMEVKAGRTGGVFALNTDELLATEMMDGES